MDRPSHELGTAGNGQASYIMILAPDRAGLGCENIGRDQISPKFLEPEMQKHRQGSNFPKIPKIWATIARALPIDARILGILGKFDPCRCIRI